MKIVYCCPDWEQYLFFVCPKCSQLTQATVRFEGDCTYQFKCQSLEDYNGFPIELMDLSMLNCLDMTLLYDFWAKHGDPSMDLKSGWWFDDLVYQRYCEQRGINWKKRDWTEEEMVGHDENFQEFTKEQRAECDKEIEDFMESYKPKVQAYLIGLGFFPKSMRKPCDFEYTIYCPHVQHPEKLEDIKEYMTEGGYELMKKLEPIFKGCLSMQEVVPNPVELNIQILDKFKKMLSS